MSVVGGQLSPPRRASCGQLSVGAGGYSLLSEFLLVGLELVVAVVGQVLADPLVKRVVIGRGGTEAIDVAIEHRKGCGDQHRVVNRAVVGAGGPARPTSSLVTERPSCCTLPAMASSAFIFSDSGACGVSASTESTMFACGP